MESDMQCPKCGSSDIEKRNHEQILQKAGGVLLTSAGAAAGTVGGAASGASIGAAIGTVAGPLGIIVGGTVGTFVGAISVGITGGFIGHRFGKKAGVIVDKNIFLEYQCKNCNHRFQSKT
jgi:predicted nucleic-acid-binding Zn-ribbon protein